MINSDRGRGKDDESSIESQNRGGFFFFLFFGDGSGGAGWFRMQMLREREKWAEVKSATIPKRGLMKVRVFFRKSRALSHVCGADSQTKNKKVLGKMFLL